MSLEPILNNATPEELAIIGRIAARANAKPAIVVTVDGRRYVVDQADEPSFDGVPDGKVPVAPGTPASNGHRPPSVYEIRSAREEHLGRFNFGCRWMRSFGKVDECYRSLSTWEVTKVERVDRKKVWGR